MFLHHILWATPVALLAVSVATAQPVVDSGFVQNTPTPSLTEVQYKSAFSDYVPYSEQNIVNWRQANDLVGQIGGWRTYAKEAHQKDPIAAQPQLNPSSPSTLSPTSTSTPVRPDTSEAKR